MRALLILVFAALPATLTAQGEVGEFDAPATFLLSTDELEPLKRRIQRDPAVGGAFARLRAEADRALLEAPRPLREIVYEGRVSSAPERLQTIRHLQDMRKLRALAWAYAVTGREVYAEAGRRFVTAWARTYAPTGNPINENKLVDAVLAYHLLGNALGADRSSVEAWLRRIADAEIGSTDPRRLGNWHAKRIKIVQTIGLAVGEPRYVDYARGEYEKYVEASLRADGGSYDLEERDALHYHVSGLNPLLEVALAARSTADDLYRYTAPNGASLRKSVEYVLPFARGEKVHPEWVHSRVALDRRRWESGDERYRPGIPWEPRESAEMFDMAAVFDPSLIAVARRVAPVPAPELAWERVLLQHLSRRTDPAAPPSP